MKKLLSIIFIPFLLTGCFSYNINYRCFNYNYHGQLDIYGTADPSLWVECYKGAWENKEIWENIGCADINQLQTKDPRDLKDGDTQFRVYPGRTNFEGYVIEVNICIDGKLFIKPRKDGIYYYFSLSTRGDTDLSSGTHSIRVEILWAKTMKPCYYGHPPNNEIAKTTIVYGKIRF